MFLPAESSYGRIPSTSGEKDVDNPYLCGFLYSRPGDPQPTRHSHQAALTRSPNDITLDYYHHPAKRQNCLLRYVQAFDLYS